MRNKFLLLLIGSLVGLGLSCRKEGNVQPRIINDDFDVVLQLNPGKNNPRNSEGDFITLKNGNILFGYSHFTGSSDDNAPAYIAGRMSYDSGKTWSDKDIVLVPNQGKINVMSVSFLRLKNGNIAMFYIVKNSNIDCKPYMRISTDEAVSWSEPINCIPHKKGYFVLNNNRVIQLKNGRLLLPVSEQTDEELVWQHIGRLTTYYSDDNGRSWKAGEYVPNPRKILNQEPGVVELNDGRILMVFRTNQGRQYYSCSKDLGQTWSASEPSNLRSPISPASINRMPITKELIAVWNNNVSENQELKQHRTPFNLALSKDEGKTWGPLKILADNSDGVYCYSAIHFVGSHVLIAHCAGSMSKGTGLSVLNITRVSNRWIYGE